MADYKVVDAQQLDGDLTVLADAIRERAGSSGKMAFPHGMAQTVKSIPTGGVTLPTLENPVTEAEVFLGKEYIDGNGQMATGSFTIDDELTEQDDLILQISNALRNKAANNGSVALPELTNPATASDLVQDKQLIDSDGNVVTGNIPEYSGDKVAVANLSELYHINNYVRVTGITSLNSRYDGLLLRPGAQQRIFVPDEEFGDARQEDVAAGRYFTSSNGIKLPGTHVCEGGVTLPELGDTAAKPTDMAADKVLYDDDGNQVTGTLAETEVGTYVWAADDIIRTGNSGETTFNISGVYGKRHIGSDTSHGFICRPGAILALRNVSTSLFGNALPEQVAKGATFTSAAGLVVEGTMEASSGGGLAVKKGNTSSPTIETGLSSIDYFVLMADSFSMAGLMQLLYRKPNNAISYILCTSYSYNSTKTELNHASIASSTLFTVDGGKVTWNGTGTSAFMSGASYMWIAVGTE